MPKVLIHFDTVRHEYSVHDSWDWTPNPEYETIVDMKSGTWKEIQRNMDRWNRDQTILNKLFIEAQMSGRAIRER